MERLTEAWSCLVVTLPLWGESFLRSRTMSGERGGVRCRKGEHCLAGCQLVQSTTPKAISSLEFTTTLIHKSPLCMPIWDKIFVTFNQNILYSAQYLSTCNTASHRNQVQWEACVLWIASAYEHFMQEASSWGLVHHALANEVFIGHFKDYYKMVSVYLLLVRNLMISCRKQLHDEAQ